MNGVIAMHDSEEVKRVSKNRIHFLGAP
jgi:hypothetical protein